MADDIGEDLEYAIEKFGPVAEHAPMPATTLSRLEGRVPDTLVAWWRRYGQSSILNGEFQVVDPEAYRPLLEALFRGDPDFDASTTHVFAIGATGGLDCWSETWGDLSIGTFPNRLISEKFIHPETQRDDIDLGTVFSMADDSGADPYDDKGRDLLPKIRKLHGPLEFGQVYAPKLHPALGGPRTAENFRPASALEAISLIHQAEPVILTDASVFPPKDIRVIGQG
ncbi:GAD-like domain-containing protein [Roseicyclus sp. F158]|uniref:GAD-like domain-containing protein n=1 Tax=Tropicimonas omnivorans TaxID=3075590 RepID=A0ABU3DJU2_9RHOB|nr:GAD-like domain-containing protein [Roseicyclus sp. F158]MDT0683382.1 GAD-like domain-containing protein [Roseicyclus sp. F158]